MFSLCPEYKRESDVPAMLFRQLLPPKSRSYARRAIVRSVNNI